MSSSTKIDNRKQDILILVLAPTQGLEHILSAEEMYSISFTKSNNKFCLSLHYNGANSYLFVNGSEIHKFKATPLSLRNISKDGTIHNMKNWINGYIYDFNVDYDILQLMIF